MKRNKSEIISFKADSELSEAMKGIPNRSEFIRNAILMALDNSCPLCGGTGILTPAQKEHWADFAIRHSVEQCDKCNEIHLVCANDPEPENH